MPTSFEGAVAGGGSVVVCCDMMRVIDGLDECDECMLMLQGEKIVHVKGCASSHRSRS